MKCACTTLAAATIPNSETPTTGHTRCHSSANRSLKSTMPRHAGTCSQPFASPRWSAHPDVPWDFTLSMPLNQRAGRQGTRVGRSGDIRRARLQSSGPAVPPVGATPGRSTACPETSRQYSRFGDNRRAPMRRSGAPDNNVDSRPPEFPGSLDVRHYRSVAERRSV